MSTANNRREQGWEWRELLWQDTITPEAAAEVLERIATAEELGAVVLEVRADHDGVRWLIATTSAAVGGLVGHVGALPVRVLTPRRTRAEMVSAGRVRLLRPVGTLNGERAQAITRTLFGGFTRLGRGEQVVLQLLLGPRLTPGELAAPAPPGWLELLVGAPASRRPGTSDLVHRKRGTTHGFAGLVRIGATAVTPGRVRQLIIDVFGALRVAETAGTRLRLTPANPREITQVSRPWKWPLRVSSHEAVSLLGWPVGAPPLPVLGSLHPRILPPPAHLVATERVIGVTAAPGTNTPVGIPVRDALTHLHVLGPTNSGKSTLLLSLIRADIHAGRGVLVLDPKGDLAVDVLAHIPEHRLDDVVIIDSSSTHPVGLNPLAASSRAPELVADSLLAAFRSVFASSFGVRSVDVFTAAFTTLGRIPGANLLWLTPLLTNKTFRHRALRNIDDPLGVGAFWESYEAKNERQLGQELETVFNKVRQLTMRPGLRAVLGQAHPRFDLADLFTRRRIVIVNLNKGLLGADSARLLGSLIMGQLWSLILERQRLPKPRRHTVTIYIDEVQDFLKGIPGDLTDALALSRSLGVAFTLAHQHLAQLSSDMRQAIDANTRSKVYFGLGSKDATELARTMTGLDAQDLMLLPKYHAYATLMQDGNATGWTTITTTPPAASISDPAQVAAHSQTLYGVSAVETDQAVIDLITPNGTRPEASTDEPIGRVPR
ncbi:type IV secretory system conjugative DNA transfer family protein [Pseudoclavibacter sp. CFCC 11306]|uniref:type IV secretory system conjugative DNA transfer family protein n=1 Tax=Pseudoclavibacter sp. CFCC 11306 TaxID=1564493 RepID=UPI001300DFE2|nr:type IV secretion system DNA-binding domain-containing protein [Pseudoclavibacter sp. CFCC 11306]KAB1658170.1 type IV secretory system conjugative DNA transfer family protein [Pseudoclavibacter sp. CFCC 11306]